MWTLRPFYSTNDRHGNSFPVSKLVSYVEMKQAKQQMLLLQDIWHRKKGTVTIYDFFFGASSLQLHRSVGNMRQRAGGLRPPMRRLRLLLLS